MNIVVNINLYKDILSNAFQDFICRWFLIFLFRGFFNNIEAVANSKLFLISNSIFASIFLLETFTASGAHGLSGDRRGVVTGNNEI